MKLSLQILLTLAFLHLAYTTHAQNSWQWGKRGGGFETLKESVTDMATDNAGNLYVLTTVHTDGLPTIAGYPSNVSVGTNSSTVDILVASYDCNGGFRWKKIIGGYAGDYAIALGVDTLGHVYIAGRAIQSGYAPFPFPQQEPIHFDTDSTQAFGNWKQLFVVQYDTSGQLNWIRWPAPDTATYSYQHRYSAYDMIVGKDGRVDMLCDLPKSLIGNAASGTVVADTARIYILSYNVQGNITGLIKPEFNMSTNLHPSPTGALTGVPLGGIRMAMMPNGNYVISGTQTFESPPVAPSDPMVIGGQPVLSGMFVAMFNSQWQWVWTKTGSTQENVGGFKYRPVSDGKGNIIIGGSDFPGIPNTFNGYTFTNPPIGHGIPFVVKLDGSGNTIWIRNAFSNTACAGGGSIR